MSAESKGMTYSRPLRDDRHLAKRSCRRSARARESNGCALTTFGHFCRSDSAPLCVPSPTQSYVGYGHSVRTAPEMRVFRTAAPSLFGRRTAAHALFGLQDVNLLSTPRCE